MTFQLPFNDGLARRRTRLVEHLADLVGLVPAEQRNEAVALAAGIAFEIDRVMVDAGGLGFGVGVNIRATVLALRAWTRRLFGIGS